MLVVCTQLGAVGAGQGPDVSGPLATRPPRPPGASVAWQTAPGVAQVGVGVLVGVAVTDGVAVAVGVGVLVLIGVLVAGAVGALVGVLMTVGVAVGAASCSFATKASKVPPLKLLWDARLHGSRGRAPPAGGPAVGYRGAAAP